MTQSTPQKSSGKGRPSFTSHIAIILLCLTAGHPQVAFSQSTPQRPAEDPKLAAAQAAFETMTVERRKSIQSDLIWVASFTGAVSGNFGPLTYRALQTLQRNSKASARGKDSINGMPSPEDYKTLAVAAQKARDSVRFVTRTDARSNTRIGLPEALLPRRENNTLGGTRWQTADLKLTIDTIVTTNETLEQQFERLTASTSPTRKITYRLLRPDFFVITGETPTGKFYRRSVKGDAELRGFSIGYDKALVTQWDVLVLAMTNTFEAFPTAIHPPAAISSTVGNAQPVSVLAIEPRRISLATGLVLGDGIVVTARAGLTGCRNPKIGSTVLKDMITDAASGVVLAQANGLRRKMGPIEWAGGSSDAFTVLAYGLQGQTATLQASPLTHSPMQNAMKPRIAGLLQTGAAGSPIFDHQGHLFGMVVSQPESNSQTANPMRAVPMMAAQHEMANTTTLRSFLATRGITLSTGKTESAPLTTGQIVAQSGDDVVAITCDP